MKESRYAIHQHPTEESKSDDGETEEAKSCAQARVIPCSPCHIPYHRSVAPFSRMKMVRCGW